LTTALGPPADSRKTCASKPGTGLTRGTEDLRGFTDPA
jgi:hypothetical protein